MRSATRTRSESREHAQQLPVGTHQTPSVRRQAPRGQHLIRIFGGGGSRGGTHAMAHAPIPSIPPTHRVAKKCSGQTISPNAGSSAGFACGPAVGDEENSFVVGGGRGSFETAFWTPPPQSPKTHQRDHLRLRLALSTTSGPPSNWGLSLSVALLHRSRLYGCPTGLFVYGFARPQPRAMAQVHHAAAAATQRSAPATDGPYLRYAFPAPAEVGDVGLTSASPRPSAFVQDEGRGMCHPCSSQTGNTALFPERAREGC